MEPLINIPVDYTVNVTMDDITLIKICGAVLIVIVLGAVLSTWIKKAIA